MIDFFNEDVPFPKIKKSNVKALIKTIISDHSRSLDNVNIIFCSDEYLLTINKDYLAHDYFTDIITFQYSDTEISSDIFISLDRVEDNSRSFSVPYITELHRIIIHGILHLVGYDDKTENDKSIMTLKEDFYLEKIV